MSKSEFLADLQKILEAEAVTDDLEITPVTWDSLEILGTIALIDKAGQSVKVADIMGCKSVDDLLQLAGTR